MKEIKIYKREVDDLIRLTKKFWKTGDSDFLKARKELIVNSECANVGYYITDIVETMATIISNHGGTYKQVYQSLEAFGVTIIGLDDNFINEMQGVE